MADVNVGEYAAFVTENYSGKIADNISDHNPLIFELRKVGNVMPVDGGSKIRQELEYEENGTFKFYSGFDTLSVTASRNFDAADYDWKQANVNVVISGEDEMKIRGKSAIHNFVSKKIKNAEKTAMNRMGASLFSDGTGSGGKEVGGLQLLVADDPTTGTVGGINRATETWWRNQTYDFSTESVGNANASASNIRTGMNQLFIRCTRMNDKPKMVIADDNYFRFYEDSLVDVQRITKTGVVEGGFIGLEYKGITVYHDDNTPANHMYFLNTDYIFLRESPTRRFTKGETKAAINQDAKVTPMYWGGNLTMSNAALQGVAKN